jgi:hypothetical protein
MDSFIKSLVPRKKLELLYMVKNPVEEIFLELLKLGRFVENIRYQILKWTL